MAGKAKKAWQLISTDPAKSSESNDSGEEKTRRPRFGERLLNADTEGKESTPKKNWWVRDDGMVMPALAAVSRLLDPESIPPPPEPVAVEAVVDDAMAAVGRDGVETLGDVVISFATVEVEAVLPQLAEVA
jgi:hypothetical protein